jgi:hypothetical protein
MQIEAAHVGIMLAGLIVGIVLDCNRRVRELQKTSDLHTRWLDAHFHHRQGDTPKEARAGRRRRHP